MKDNLEIKWPWTLVWIEFIDDFIAQIRDALPPDHELQKHKLFPGIKWNGRPIFIVEDDTTGKYILINFEKRRRWKKTKFKVPTIKVLKNRQEAARILEHDHAFEETLSKIFPDVQFLGWQVWQWVLWLINLVLTFLLAFIINGLRLNY